MRHSIEKLLLYSHIELPSQLCLYLIKAILLRMRLHVCEGSISGLISNFQIW